jgi:hypothetical protein
MYSVVGGVVLTLLGGVFIGISFNVQKQAHNQVAGPQVYKSRMWLWGMILMGPGEICNIAGLTMAPASLCSPMGVSGIVVSYAVARVWLKERLGRLAVGGMVVVVVAGVMIALSMPATTELRAVALLRDEMSDGFTLFMAVTVCLALMANFSGHILAITYVMSVYGLVTTLGCRIVFGLAHTVAGTPAEDCFLYGIVVGVTCVAVAMQIVMFQRALQAAKVSIVTPLIFSQMQALVAVGSALLFNTLGLLNVPLYFVGLGGVIVGSWAICQPPRANVPDVVSIEIT